MNEYIVGLLLMVALSTLGGWLISYRKDVEKPVKIMLFVLYFWAFLFTQVALFSLGYYLFEKLG